MFRHTCVLPNHQFYFYILAVSSALLCIYILCNLYNLVSQKTNMCRKICKVFQFLATQYFWDFLQIRKIHLTSFNSDDFSGVDNMASDGSNVSHYTQVQVSECDSSGLYDEQSHFEIGENYDWWGLMNISAAMPWVFHIREHVYKPKTIKVTIRTTTTITTAVAARITMTISWAFYTREHVYKPKERDIITTTAATKTMTITWAFHIREHVDQPSYSSEKNVISTDNFLTVYFDRCEYSDHWHLFTKILLLNNTRP